QIDGTTILEGYGPPSTLQGVLSRKKEELTPAMKAACKDADFSRSLLVVVSFKDVKKQGELADLFGDPAALDLLESLVVSMNFGSSDINIQGVAVCKDAKSAKDIHKLLEGAIAGARLTGKDLPKEVRVLLDQVKFEQSDTKVRLTMKVTKDQVAALIK